jgi:hypothetical protein
MPSNGKYYLIVLWNWYDHVNFDMTLKIIIESKFNRNFKNYINFEGIKIKHKVTRRNTRYTQHKTLKTFKVYVCFTASKCKFDFLKIISTRRKPNTYCTCRHHRRPHHSDDPPPPPYYQLVLQSGKRDGESEEST